MGLYDSGYSDEFVTKGFLSKEDILSYATESQIFYMVFGFFPKEYQYTVSPFRDDKTPGAFFENFYLESEKKEKMYLPLRYFHTIRLKGDTASQGAPLRR